MAEPIVVRAFHPLMVYRLKKVFVQGLNTDFGYFPDNYISATKRQNTSLHFLLAYLNPKRLILIAKTPKNEIRGFVIASIIDCDECYIFWIYVDPKYRGSGIGKMLINELFSRIKPFKLKKVVLATHNMVDFYKKFDFRICDDKTFAIENVNMYIMEASVNEKA